jgi:hypothetical protein
MPVWLWIVAGVIVAGLAAFALMIWTAEEGDDDG